MAYVEGLYDNRQAEASTPGQVNRVITSRRRRPTARVRPRSTNIMADPTEVSAVERLAQMTQAQEAAERAANAAELRNSIVGYDALDARIGQDLSAETSNMERVRDRSLADFREQGTLSGAAEARNMVGRGLGFSGLRRVSDQRRATNMLRGVNNIQQDTTAAIDALRRRLAGERSDLALRRAAAQQRLASLGG